MTTKKLPVRVSRTAMCGGGLSYDVYVPESACPEHVRNACPGGTYYTRIESGAGGPFMDYPTATLPRTWIEMPQGWERYQAYKLHEAQARREMLQIALLAFPELSKVAARTDSLPELWVDNLMEKETSADVWLEIEMPERLN